MKLILPVAGQSTRFPKGRPKWLLPHPSGNLMFYQGLLGLNLGAVDEVILICLEDHFREFHVEKVIARQWAVGAIPIPYRLVPIAKTESQPESVSRGLRAARIGGPIFIKDCDTYYEGTVRPGNSVTTVHVGQFAPRDAASKSYVETDADGTVVNIAEKVVISDTFCVGGYSFSSAKQFQDYYGLVAVTPGLYVSHVIYRMLLDGISFKSEPVKRFQDWGTIGDWNHYLTHHGELR